MTEIIILIIILTASPIVVVIVINFLPDHTPLLLLPSAPLISIVDVFILTGDIDRASRPILLLRGSVSLSVCYHQGISCLKATRRSEVAWPVSKSYKLSQNVFRVVTTWPCLSWR